MKWLPNEHAKSADVKQTKPYADGQLYTKDANGQYQLWKEDRPLLTRVISFLNFLKK